MSMIIAEVEKEEADEIEAYFERLNSLRELALAFESDDIFNKKSNMYEKILDDIFQTRKKFDGWWEKIIEKYDLHDYNREMMRVDFLSHKITLINGTQPCHT